MMSKSPNSQDFADNELSLGELCKIWQTANQTHITCGYTKELPKESTNLGSDTNVSYQTGKSLDCSMQTEGFGIKTGSQYGILEMGDFSMTFPSGPGTSDGDTREWKRPSTPLTKQETEEYSKGIFFDSDPKIICIFISM